MCYMRSGASLRSPWIETPERVPLNTLAFLKKALRMFTNKPLVIVVRGPWYRWAFERLGLEYRHEEQGREALQTPKGGNCSIPPQAKREKPHTGNKEPKPIPKPIHTILPGREGEVSKNAYPDTIRG
jgi:hypothetical protein